MRTDVSESFGNLDDLGEHYYHYCYYYYYYCYHYYSDWDWARLPLKAAAKAGVLIE